MRFGFWKRSQKKHPFDASLILDNPDIKIVEARYNEKPVFFGVGISKQREKGVAAGVGPEGVEGKYAIQKELQWKMFYNKDNMPTGFIPIEKLEEWMKGTTAVVSGSMSVYGMSSQNPKPVEKEEYDKALNRISESAAEKRIQEIKEEVERVLYRLGKIETGEIDDIQAEDDALERKSKEQKKDVDT